ATLPHMAPDIGAGRAAYDSADFKKAIRYFQAAFNADPDNPEASFWLGRSYEVLTDVTSPFYSSHRWAKAHFYLQRAVKLAPDRRDYRREYFDFLLESADHSRGSLSEAERFLNSMPESDPDFVDMAARLRE